MSRSIRSACDYESCRLDGAYFRGFFCNCCIANIGKSAGIGLQSQYYRAALVELKYTFVKDNVVVHVVV